MPIMAAAAAAGAAAAATPAAAAAATVGTVGSEVIVVSKVKDAGCLLPPIELTKATTATVLELHNALYPGKLPAASVHAYVIRVRPLGRRIPAKWQWDVARPIKPGHPLALYLPPGPHPMVYLQVTLIGA